MLLLDEIELIKEIEILSFQKFSPKIIVTYSFIPRSISLTQRFFIPNLKKSAEY